MTRVDEFELLAQRSQRLLGIVDMLGHRGSGSFRVAPHDGVVDVGVLDACGLAPVRRLGQDQRMLLEDGPHVLDQLDDQRIARRNGDRDMEVGIELVALGRIVRIFHAREQGGELADIVIGAADGGELRRRDFQRAPHFLDMSG